MKRTRIASLTAAAALLAAAYLTGADGTASTAAQPGAGAHQAMTPAQQIMQAPALETEECTEGYILLMPCPVCHTCPVCQANCGTAHALKCCLGNKKPVFNASAGGASGGQAAAPQKQHIMTNKAEAVKHAAGQAPAGTDGAVISVFAVESE